MVKKLKNKLLRKSDEDSNLSWLYIFGGLVAFLSAFDLMVEKIEIIKDPTFEPSCNINPILSCGSVMITPQAEAFGFPNPLLGIAGFAVVVAIGLAMRAGAKFDKWFWLLVQVGLTFAVGFVHWLMYQTIFNINALCPYCMIVWTATIPLFWYTTLRNTQYLKLKKDALLAKVIAFSKKHHADILLVWYLAIIGVIANHFWYYWKTIL